MKFRLRIIDFEYSLGSASLIFGPEQNQQELDLTIFEGFEIKGNETIELTLLADDPSLIDTPSTLAITIVGNDSESDQDGGVGGGSVGLVGLFFLLRLR